LFVRVFDVCCQSFIAWGLRDAFSWLYLGRVFVNKGGDVVKSKESKMGERDAGELVSFVADDQQALVGHFFAAAPEVSKKQAILFATGTGIPQYVYFACASWLAKQGFDALTFDFRGIGETLAGERVKGSTIRKQDWGELDLPAAYRYLYERTQKDVILMGHSAGGQLVGLMPQAPQLYAIVQIAGSSGYLKRLSGWLKWNALFSMNIMMPLTSRLFGYVPMKTFGWGEDLPSGVALQWAEWCRTPGYVETSFGKDIPRHYYDEIRCPVLNVSAVDDAIATEHNIDDILRLFPCAKVDRLRPAPEDYGWKSIGHSGFFSRQKQPLWEEVLRWLVALEER
tara:strand:+ start:6643 stop:7659 length:1017 start_codon:yes stop_codon:yes gene_type:complete